MSTEYKLAFVAPYKQLVTWLGLGNILLASAYPEPVIGWLVGVPLVLVGTVTGLRESFPERWGEE